MEEENEYLKKEIERLRLVIDTITDNRTNQLITELYENIRELQEIVDDYKFKDKEKMDVDKEQLDNPILTYGSIFKNSDNPLSRKR